MTDILIVGAGIFGMSAALELRQRGYSVAVADPGPIPHPLAASTDISKVVRIEYGDMPLFIPLAEQARQRWLEWNDWFGEEIYHETGVAFLTKGDMQPNSFEASTYAFLQKMGYEVERMSADTIRERFPAWNADLITDGIFNPRGGWVESGRVVSLLAEHASQQGVTMHPGAAMDQLSVAGGVANGIVTTTGEVINAEHVVIAAGSWTPYLVPDLSNDLKTTGQPVFHLRVDDPSLFEPPYFPVWGADIMDTGWYGFPYHPGEGVIKIANHLIPDEETHPDGERLITDDHISAMRMFVRTTFPALADAEIVYTRLCMYCTTPDEYLLIDHHPGYSGMSIATGGSGHSFKFGSVLGEIIADMVENQPNDLLAHFNWQRLKE